MAATSRAMMRDEAYRASVDLATETRRVPAVGRRTISGRAALRVAPAATRSRTRSASTAYATATCCRSRRPARSASPSPTTPATASSRPSRGSTRARSAWPTAASRNTRWKTTPGACTATWAATRTSCRPPSSPRWRSPRSTTWRWSLPCAVHRHRRSARRSTCPPIIRIDDFKDLYREAWQAGLKGLATYRPNNVLGAVLSVTPETKQAKTETAEEQPQDFDLRPGPAHRAGSDSDTCARLLRWPGRPELPDGSEAWVSHDPASARQLRDLRFGHTCEQPAIILSKSGSTAPSSRAA